MSKISEQFMAKLARMGITRLNAIQCAVAEVDAHVQRLMLLAPTGSGKTVAYAIALLRGMRPAAPGQAPRHWYWRRRANWLSKSTM